MITWTPGVSLEDAQERIIKEALHFYRDEKRTADALKISHEYLKEKLQEYEVKKKIYDEELAVKREKDLNFERRARGLKPLDAPIEIEVPEEEIPHAAIISKTKRKYA